jgi:hypothetical protein
MVSLAILFGSHGNGLPNKDADGIVRIEEKERKKER